MHEINPLWIPILGILMPIVLVPMIMMLKHRTLQREWQHKERMKAIEMGAPPPPPTAGGSVVAIGAGVPIASVIAAAVTSLSYQPNSERRRSPRVRHRLGMRLPHQHSGHGLWPATGSHPRTGTERNRVATRDERRQADLRSRRLRRRFEPQADRWRVRRANRLDRDARSATRSTSPAAPQMPSIGSSGM